MRTSQGFGKTLDLVRFEAHAAFQAPSPSCPPYHHPDQDLTPWWHLSNFRLRHQGCSCSRVHSAPNAIPSTKHHRTHITGHCLCPTEINPLERVGEQDAWCLLWAKTKKPHGERHGAQDGDDEDVEAGRGAELPVSHPAQVGLGASCKTRLCSRRSVVQTPGLSPEQGRVAAACDLLWVPKGRSRWVH